MIDEQLLSLCLDLFMAGSETTSNTLEFIVLYLVKYTDVQRRMQDEMDNVIGRNRWPTLQDRNRFVLPKYRLAHIFNELVKRI